MRSHAREKAQRLRARSAELRLQSIKAQLSTGFTFCGLVESDISPKSNISKTRIDEAHNVVARLRHTVESVRKHLDEPHHVPPDSLADARDELERLENRVIAVEERLREISIEKLIG